MAKSIVSSLVVLIMALAPAAAQEGAVMTPPMETAGGSAAADNGRWWFSADYLLWWIKAAPTGGPLVTQGSASDTIPGALGQPGTTVLYGNHDISYGPFSGGRFAAVYALDPEGTVSIEAAGFFLAQRSSTAHFASDANGNPVLANPIIDQRNGDPSAFDISFPDVIRGLIDIRSVSRLWGVEANLAAETVRDDLLSMKLLGGFRYLDLREGLTLSETSTAVVGGAVPYLGAVYSPNGGGTLPAVALTDAFGTRNEFYGGQIGIESEAHVGRLFLGLTGKVALGDVHETLNVAGDTHLLGVPGVPTTPTPQPIRPTGGPMTTAPGGLYALPTGIGNYDRNRFAVLPEVDIKVGYRLTERLSAFVAYDFLYLSDVVRPGNQINHEVDLNRVPSAFEFQTANVPAASNISLHSSDFWAQGISFGMALQF